VPFSPLHTSPTALAEGGLCSLPTWSSCKYDMDANRLTSAAERSSRVSRPTFTCSSVAASSLVSDAPLLRVQASRTCQRLRALGTAVVGWDCRTLGSTVSRGELCLLTDLKSVSFSLLVLPFLSAALAATTRGVSLLSFSVRLALSM
jgi:hypothetical protein